MSAIAHARVEVPVARLRVLAPWLAVIAATLVAFLFTRTNSDVSWLLTLGERWRAGDVPYVDFIEVNPPASIMLYMPAVLLAAGTGVRPETWVVVLTTMAAVVSVVATTRLLGAAALLSERDRGFWSAAMLALLLLVPTGTFAEREHLAAIAMLPFLALVAVRLGGQVTTSRVALAAGLGCGLALAIKPVFGLALLGPLAWLLVRRGWRTALRAPELHAAWIVPALYGAAVPLLFPRYTSEILPWVLVAYAPLRFSLGALLFAPVGLIAVGLCATAFLVGARRPDAWIGVLVLAACGFGGAYVLQGKAWPYQALPAVLLGALAALAALADPVRAARDNRRRLVGTAGFCALVGTAAVVFNNHPNMGATIPGLERALSVVAPHPTVMAFTSDLALGHPLVRDVGGHWVGSMPTQWIVACAERRRAGGVSAATGAELDRIVAIERGIAAHDLAMEKPDAVLVDGPEWRRYIADSPQIAEAFAAYRLQGTFEGISLWVRSASS